MKKIFSFLIPALVFVCISCNNAGSDPQDVVRNFFTAVQQKNFTEAKKYATKDSQHVLDMIAGVAANNETENSGEQFDVKNIHINGDDATADVMPAGTTKGVTVFLKKEDGEWKIAFDVNSLLNMSKQVDN